MSRALLGIRAMTRYHEANRKSIGVPRHSHSSGIRGSVQAPESSSITSYWARLTGNMTYLDSSVSCEVVFPYRVLVPAFRSCAFANFSIKPTNLLSSNSGREKGESARWDGNRQCCGTGRGDGPAWVGPVSIGFERALDVMRSP